jgi:hypothetical protein
MPLTNPLGTIITSFPSTWDEHEDFNLSNILDKEIRENGHRRMIKSAEDLLHLIVKTSVDFIKREGPAGFSLQESFRDSVTKLSEKQIKFFEDFRTTTWKLQNDKFGKEEKNKQRDLLLSVHREVGLLAEAMDIQDELSIVNTVLLQQMNVLRNLLDLCFTEDEPSEGQQKKGLKDGDRLNSDPQMLRELLQLMTETAVSNRAGSPSRQSPNGMSKSVQGQSVSNIYPDGGVWRGRSHSDIDMEQHARRLRDRKRGKGTEGTLLRNHNLVRESIEIVDGSIRVVGELMAIAEKTEFMVS